MSSTAQTVNYLESVATSQFTGVVLTDMVASVDADSMEALREETPLGRHGLPADIVKAMAYLIDADFVTGQVLAVNGGLVI